MLVITNLRISCIPQVAEILERVVSVQIKNIFLLLMTNQITWKKHSAETIMHKHW